MINIGLTRMLIYYFAIIHRAEALRHTGKPASLIFQESFVGAHGAPSFLVE
jgi:hypothetical protein